MGVRVEALGSQGWKERAYRRGRKSGRAQMLLAAKSGKESQSTRRKALPQRSLTFFSELLECNNKDQKLTTKGTKGARRAQRWKRAQCRLGSSRRDMSRVESGHAGPLPSCL